MATLTDVLMSWSRAMREVPDPCDPPCGWVHREYAGEPVIVVAAGFRCWFCGAPAAPLVKCACGGMVATTGLTLVDPS